MKKLLILSTITLLSTTSFCQIGNLAVPQGADSTVLPAKKGSNVAGLIAAELLIGGMSYYASLPKAHGDKVIGWLYAGAAAATLIYLPFYWFDKENNADRVWNMITMLGLSYGFSRIATYNLLHSDDDPFHTRFTRNLLEMHAAYIIPIALGALVEKWTDNKRKKKNQTGLGFSAGPSSLYFVYRF